MIMLHGARTMLKRAGFARIALVCAVAALCSFNSHAGEPKVFPPIRPIELEPLSRAILTSPELEELDRQRVVKLEQRVLAFFSVWNQGPVEEYERLMRGWGGQLGDDGAGESYQRMRKTDWSLLGTECSFRTLGVDKLRVRVIDGMLDDRRTVAAWPDDQGTGMGCHHVCVFSFGRDQSRLAAAGERVVEVVMPVVTYDGMSFNFGMRWIWEPESEEWVPWTMFQRTDPGKPLCVFFY